MPSSSSGQLSMRVDLVARPLTREGSASAAGLNTHGETSAPPASLGSPRGYSTLFGRPAPRLQSRRRQNAHLQGPRQCALPQQISTRVVGRRANEMRLSTRAGTAPRQSTPRQHSASLQAIASLPAPREETSLHPAPYTQRRNVSG